MFWTGDHPGELCLALLQVRIIWTVDKFRGGVEARGRETPIQAFFGGKDRQTGHKDFVSSGRTELKSVRRPLDGHSVLLPVSRPRSRLD